MDTPHFQITEKNLEAILSLLADRGDFVFLDSNRADNEDCRSYIFTDIIDRITLKCGERPEIFFARAEEYLKKGFYLAGWMAYELGYLLEPSLNSLQDADCSEILADLGVFPAPVIFNHKTGMFNSDIFTGKDNPSSEKAAKEIIDEFSIKNIQPSQSKDDYLKKIAQVQSYIEEGDTYQVNYTLKLRFDFHGDPSSLYKTLRRNQRVSYGAYIKLGGKTIQSFSPEIFFRKKGDICTVRPMKGTSQRGKTSTEDLQMTNQLRHDSKNRSENVMIVDLLRNDLGRICRMGEVETISLFDVETYQTLHQMTSTIRGNLLPGISMMEIFKAIFPCGSVTGAPKIRTMEIIKELESVPRGVYTGAIGFITPKLDMVFNVPIRTIVLNNNQGEMGIGSGIVHDSDPENEWQECMLKSRFITEPAADFQLIETVLWTHENGFFLLTQHLQRLELSAVFFNFPINPGSILEKLEKEAAIWQQEEQDQANDKNHSETSRRVRLLLHRDGHFSITATPCHSPAITSLPFRQKVTPSQKVALSKKRTDPTSPFLFHKTTVRQEYDQQLQEARRKGFLDVIFQNDKDEVTEGAVSNIVIRKKERYFTPPFTCGLLAGTLRNHLLETCDQLEERKLSLQDIEEADAIFMINSVRGLVEVTLNKTE